VVAARQHVQARASEDVFLEEELHDARGEPGQRELAGPHHALAIDAREHALVTQPLDRVRGAPANVLRLGLHERARVREYVLELLLAERREARAFRTKVQRDQEAHVDGRQIDRDLAIGDRRNHLIEVAALVRHRRLGEQTLSRPRRSRNAASYRFDRAVRIRFTSSGAARPTQ